MNLFFNVVTGVLCIALFTNSSILKKESNPCNIMKRGKFLYLDVPDKTAYFTISGNKHMEFHQNKKYTITSTIEWLSDCSYEATLIDFNYPNFPLQKGDKMLVEIEKVEGDIISYRGVIKGESFTGRVRKVK